jgi:multisubunit Na+/H+ antiporter MnhG subunit
MRSSHWQYLGYVLVGVGSGLSASGLIAFIYFQQPYLISSLARAKYQPFTLPLLIVGICIIAVGILTFRRDREKRRHETEGEIQPIYLPPPPPPPLPPPP